jgi:hypothetical protein
MATGAMCVWDFTASKEVYESESEVIKLCKAHCKKWVFQLEKGKETGFLHFQGRVSLKNKMREVQVRKLFPKIRISLTSAENRDNFHYVEKEDTRVDDKIWRWDDENIVMTKQLTLFLEWELRPYQKKISNWGNEFNMRNIDLIYDPIGNLGKSIFVEYLEYIGMAEDVPPFRMMDDIFEWVATRPIKKMYCFDMPRGMKKDKLGDFYSGIEVIKNGVAYDKRYSGTKKRFDRPRVVVFTNTLPNFELMSMDRWNVWEVTPDYDIKPYAGEGCVIKDVIYDDDESNPIDQKVKTLTFW